MSKLGAIANTLKTVVPKVAKIGIKKVIPGYSAYELLKPTALASEGEGYWGEDNQWHEGSKPVKAVGGQGYEKPIGPENKPPSALDSPANSGGSGSGSGSSDVIKAIGKGWDDADDELGSAKKSLKSAKTYVSNLGKVRDKYIESAQKYKGKVDEAIAGNKKLIEQNQKKELDLLAGDTRKSIDNTNVMLGVKGASGGSASRAAARAIAQSAGRERSKILTSRGDEMSYQNLESKKAAEDLTTRIAQANAWEKSESKRALEEFNDYEDAIERLKNKKSGWKDEDIQAESDKNLSKFLSTIYDIKSKSKLFRDNIAAKAAEYGLSADELEIEAINVNAPAELDTPQFSENIDLTEEEQAEDWYDPQKQGKRVIKGYDAMGNPIYEDTLDDKVVA